MGETFLSIENVTKSFAQTTVVRNVDIAIDKGEFVSFLGPSGCGKTTTLRMVAGFEGPTTGRIVIDGKEVTDLKPNQRNIGMVFQSYALFPNMTVAQNIAFGLKVAGASSDAIAARVKEMLGIIKLPEHGGRYPFQLSGGQQQRVALARALAVKPSVLLLDEPLSALDAKIRISLRAEIRAIQRELGITTIYVTHDQEEALSMSDRIVVMNEGRVEQIGTPVEIYNQPRTRFVASFVGTLTILAAKAVDAKKGTMKLDGQQIRAGKPFFSGAGKDISVALRPEAIALGKGGDNANRLTAKVVNVNFLGSIVRVKVRSGTQDISLDMFNQSTTAPPKVGEQVTVNFNPDDLVVLEGPPEA
jgi:putative spermidine/putrescine transport system ATP-binding protein